jgi:hypothetical protein
MEKENNPAGDPSVDRPAFRRLHGAKSTTETFPERFGSALGSSDAEFGGNDSRCSFFNAEDARR